MAQRITCPNCLATFKAKSLPAWGSRVKCAKCQQAFVLHASQLTELHEAGVPPSSPSRPIAPPAAMSPSPAPLIELPADLELEEIGPLVPEPRPARPAPQA